GTQLTPVTEVDGLDVFDALAIDLVRSHLDLVRDGREDRELVRGVETADVVGRIGFRIARGLRLRYRLLQGKSGGSHATEHVVRRAVDDRRDTFDAVRLQVGAEGADQRNPPADRRLEVKVHVFLGRQVEELRTVLRHHDLVRGDDVLSCLE